MELLLIASLAVCSLPGCTQPVGYNADSLLVGTWKGTSICQIASSPCHDEKSVCHIKKGSAPNTYHVTMNKVINDKEEEVGEEDFIFDYTHKTLTCWDEKYKIAWNFTVNGTTMEGTLVYEKKVYRIIKLTKVSSG